MADPAHEQQLAELQQQLHAALAANAALQQQQQQPPHAPQQNALAQAVLKLPPEQWSGSLGDRKHLEDWLFSVNERFDLLHPPPSELDKIRYAGNLLTGAARKWYRTKAPLLRLADVTYAHFVEALCSRFAPFNRVNNVRERLLNLEQTSSVAAYSNTFTELMLELDDISAADALFRYIHGLKPHIRKLVKMREDTLNLESAMQLAERMESVDRETDRAAKALVHSRVSTIPDIRYTPPAYAAAAADPAPMELGALRFPQQRQQRYPPRYGNLGRHRFVGARWPVQRPRLVIPQAPRYNARPFAAAGMGQRYAGPSYSQGRPVDQGRPQQQQQQSRGYSNAARPRLQQGNGRRRGP